MMIQGVIHGKIIELEKEPGLPDGQPVAVDIRPIQEEAPAAQPPLPPWWLAYLSVDPAVRAGKFVIKGTRLLADALVEELEAGRADQELLRAHPELPDKALAAVREYAKLPAAMRRSFGAWAEDTQELDSYLEWSRRQRHSSRRGVED